MMRSTLKYLAPAADRSRCRSFLVAPVKSTAVADVSLTSYGGFLGGALTKMICTAANGERIFLLNRLSEDCRHDCCVDSNGYCDDWEHEIEGFRRCRSEEQIREIFETWIKLFGKVYASAEEKERRYVIFKHKVRFIEERDTFFDFNNRLGLDYFSDLTTKEYFKMKDQKSKRK